MKVLVVDDNQTLLDIVSTRLTRAGYEVYSSAEAFGLPLKVGAIKPDVVLLDVDMPGVRGDQLAMNLRHLRAARDCVVIFHSGEEEDLLRQIVQFTGAAGYIPKSVPPATFLERFRGFVDNANRDVSTLRSLRAEAGPLHDTSNETRRSR